MLTPQDVRSVQFEKNLRGYRTEDVDRFLDKVEDCLLYTSFLYALKKTLKGSLNR